jgi:glycosyltransferase involved in cell wall biosynthesis
LDAIRHEFPEQRTLLTGTDFFVCPSEAVRVDLEEQFGVGAGRSAVVPYGVDPGSLRMQVNPVAGRVLFVGTAGLRKGIHYLADASQRLHRKGRCYEFRIAGDVSRKVTNQPACRHLNFTGRVPRDCIQAEYASADVFVMPSLAEGSAESTYEALAAGLPVITTASAGSVVCHGIEGYIVPERDARNLAGAIEYVVEDRVLRTRMSAAARNRARDYTLQRYGERLRAALQDFNR